MFDLAEKALGKFAELTSLTSYEGITIKQFRVGVSEGIENNKTGNLSFTLSMHKAQYC